MAQVDLLYMYSQSTLIIKIVLIILLIMSVMSWSLIFFKLVQLSRVKKKTTNDLSIFLRAKDLNKAMILIEQSPDSPSYMVALEGINEIKRLKEIDEHSLEKIQTIIENVRDVLNEEIRVQTKRLFGSLSFLATCASVAPLLGLFGTVWGIMNSFSSFKGLTRSSLAVLAPGLAEALVTTALGLVVAIPATLAYNFLSRQLEIIESKLVKLARRFIKLIVTH